MKATRSTSLAEAWVQDPTIQGSRLYTFIQNQLRSPELTRVRVAVAYATWGGLALIAKELEGFLGRGRRLETIYGTGNGVTTADALLYSIDLQRRFASYKAALSYQWDYIDSEFHPKYWEFRYPEKVVCLIGSANCTRGGLAGNHELSVRLECAEKSDFAHGVGTIWDTYRAVAQEITPSLMRNLSSRLGRETPSPGNGASPRLGISLPRTPKPLFRHILEQTGSAETRHRTLADGDRLSQKPRLLYLQILKRETGGGHQIQLPVATLGTFFGVGPGETRIARFSFPETNEAAQVELTHFENHTHRIRLRPLKNVPRPAIVAIRRLAGKGRFEVRIVPPGGYRRVLATKCTERTRLGSRYWGLEA